MAAAGAAVRALRPAVNQPTLTRTAATARASRQSCESDSLPYNRANVIITLIEAGATTGLEADGWSDDDEGEGADDDEEDEADEDAVEADVVVAADEE